MNEWEKLQESVPWIDKMINSLKDDNELSD